MVKGVIMKNWKYINFEQRKMIVSCITHNKNSCEIAAILNVDPTSISKEVKKIVPYPNMAIPLNNGFIEQMALCLH